MKSIDLKPGDRVRILSELDQPEAIVRTVLENGNYYLEGRFCEYLSTNLMPCEEWDQLQSETLTVKRCVVEELYEALGIARNTIEKLFGDDFKKELDLNKLNQMLDEALENETPESMTEFLKEHDQKIPNFRPGEESTAEHSIVSKNELNLLELLKDCEGREVYSLLEGVTRIHKVDESLIETSYEKYGEKGDVYVKGVCLLYPSKALYLKYPLDPYSAWMEWKEEMATKSYWRVCHNLKDVEEIVLDREDGELVEYSFTLMDKETGNRFATKKLAQQASEGIRKYLQDFNKSNHYPAPTRYDV